MADSESTAPVTIIWKDYCKELQTGIWSLFKDKLLVDVSLTCHQQGLKVHRLILAVFLPGLKDSLLQSNDKSPSETLEDTSSNEPSQMQQLKIDLDLPSTTALKDVDILNLLIEFAYSGRVTVPRESLENVLTAAEQLGFEGLVSSIREHNIPAESYGEADETQTKDKLSNVPQARKSRKGIPTKLRKPIGRQCKLVISESPPTKDKNREVAISEEETVSTRNRSYEAQKEKRRRKRRMKSNVFNSDDESLEDEKEDEPGLEHDEYNGVEDEELSKSKEDEEWKPMPTLKALLKGKSSNRNKSIGCSGDGTNKPKRKPPKKMYSCDRCDYMTKNKEAYGNHLSKHDPSIKVNGFTCEYCSKTFKSKKGYRCHVRSHGDPELQFKCEHCSFSTPQKWTWRQHLAVMHKVDESGNPLEDNIACDQCDFTCVAPHQLKAHLIRKHTLDKPYKCQQCEYSTITRSELETHVAIMHRKERRYMCETCGFRSQTRNAFKKHCRTHLGIRPFKCELCGMAYTDRGKYKNHLQRHTSDEKPFVCHICGHACYRKDNLQMHMRRMHKNSLDTENVIVHEEMITDEVNGIFGK